MMDSSFAQVSSTSNKEVVKQYYDYTRLFYRFFWHGEANSLHYGFYDNETTDFKTALLKTIEVTARNAQIKTTDVVADLGCGIGGGAFWIAENIGASVYGITISEEQYKKALRLRTKLQLQDKTQFKVGDFFATGYDDQSFDAVFGIESLCHGQYAVTKLAEELYRITKFGGRLAIMDGYLGTKEMSAAEKRDVKIFEDGLALAKMIAPEEFSEALGKAGFREVEFVDYSENVLPTCERMYKLTKRWHWLTWLLVKLRLVPELMLKNNLAGQVQRDLTKNSALVYGCITAIK